MHIVLTEPQIETIDDPGDPALGAAAELLASSVPQTCAGLVAYHADGYRRFLAAAITPPPAARTLILRAVRGRVGIRAVADWRLLPGGLLLNGVAVRESERGRGLGASLLDDGRRLAERLGRRTLLLDVSTDNPAARRLYVRHGFVDISQCRWRAVPLADPDASAAVQVVNWPTFQVHREAYGFGDLTVRLGERQFEVRTVGTALRVPAESDAGRLAAGIARLLPVERCFTVDTLEPTAVALSPRSAPALAAFTRMRVELPDPSRR
ncbi:GNAT family N-acetyltransferase [Micromonospora sp. DT48]|uniref:GNAT family N-acetyltransferase n=1 Tax=unclassified Micromonospora TaxID=2617518 RepID=UPI0012BD80A2|nr:GNAT family N-acetyltransferase [Micromonospora sp. CP22]MTK02904.1 GNAT family N-acetyltransferase [Micromonospora sp. CP22]